MEHGVTIKKEKKPLYITLNGTRYTEESKCPACSGERDTGGKLEFKKRTNWFLKCIKCKYVIHSERVKLKQELYRKKRNDRKLQIVQTEKRKKKKLKITRADKKRIALFLKKRKAVHNFQTQTTPVVT